MHEDYERLYDELSGHREKPPQSNEYDPDDPLGLSSGRVTCTMATLVDPWDEATAEVFTQDGDGTWDLVMWMAGMCAVILILDGLLS